MGAWGVLAFDNDDANDWAAVFTDDTRDLALVESALAAVEQEGTRYLDQHVACRALAACEVLARLQGRPGYTNTYTSTVDAWVAAHPMVPSPEMLSRAARVIDRITASDSELRELWDDAGADEWLASVADLRHRVLPTAASPQHRGEGGVGRRFELVDDDHAKYWEISRVDATVTVHFGRIGTRGQEQTKQFDAESVAMEHVAKVILEKRRKG